MFAQRLRNVCATSALCLRLSASVYGAFEARMQRCAGAYLCVLHAVHLWVRIRTLRYI